MSINDGNPVNATYTNSRLVSKQVDNVLEGIQELKHNNLTSGADILNLQKTVNDLVTIMAIIGQGNTASNVGTGQGWFKEKIANDLRFRTVVGTNSVTINLNGDDVEIGHPVEFLAADPFPLVANTLWFNYTDKFWRFYDGITTIQIGSDYVDLSTNQSVGGEKTFTADGYFSQALQVSGKLTVLADMEVQGTLTYINTTDLEVTDQNILVNKSGTDGSSEGAGVDVERPAGNAGIRFDSTLENKWKIGLIADLREVGAVIKGTKATLIALPSKYTSVLYYATDEMIHYVWDETEFKRLTMPNLVKGGLITFDGTNYVAIAPGANGKILRTKSGATEGVIWEEVSLEDTKANIDALPRLKGLSYYATDENIYYYDNGTILIAIGGSGFTGSIPVSAKGDLVTRTASAISTLAVGLEGQRLAVKLGDPEGIAWKYGIIIALKAAIDALPRIKGEYYYATDESIFYGDDGTALIALGGVGLISGGGGGMTPTASVAIQLNGSYVVPVVSWADITITQVNATLTASQQFKIFAGDTIQIIKDATSGRVLINGNVIAELDTATYAMTGTVFS